MLVSFKLYSRIIFKRKNSLVARLEGKVAIITGAAQGMGHRMQDVLLQKVQK